jgi:hypothetical protein
MKSLKKSPVEIHLPGFIMKFKMINPSSKGRRYGAKRFIHRKYTANKSYIYRKYAANNAAIDE